MYLAIAIYALDPLSPLAAAGITAAVQAANVGGQAAAASAKNKKARRFSREMAGRQSDQTWSMWTATNNYNHPKKVMERLKAAGLNPNLAYGNPSTGGQASPINQTMGANPNFDTPRFNMDAAPMLGQYMSFKQQQTQDRIADADISLKNAQEQGILDRNTRDQEAFDAVTPYRNTNEYNNAKILDNKGWQSTVDRNIAEIQRAKDARSYGLNPEQQKMEMAEALHNAEMNIKAATYQNILQTTKNLGQTFDQKVYDQKFNVMWDSIIKQIANGDISNFKTLLMQGSTLLAKSFITKKLK